MLPYSAGMASESGFTSSAMPRRVRKPDSRTARGARIEASHGRPCLHRAAVETRGKLGLDRGGLGGVVGFRFSDASARPVPMGGVEAWHGYLDGPERSPARRDGDVGEAGG